MEHVASDIEREYDRKRAKRRETNLAHAEKGVIFFDLDMAYIEDGVEIGKGTYIGPAVIVTGKSCIGEDCIIGQNCRIENSKIARGCNVDQSVIKDSTVDEDTAVGPFAYMRPGSNVGARCKIGDFVEVKNSVIGDDTKISHLSYIGDSDLGRGINIGCGVVFVNYDGRDKHRSTVGDGAFIGCNANIISPVTIEGGSYIAAGSTVSTNVPSGALYVERSGAEIRNGWVEKRGLLKNRLEKLEGKD